MGLDFDLAQEHAQLRETVREFAEAQLAPVAEELDREGRFPVELVAAAADLGLLGIPLPEDAGGAGFDTLAYAIAIEELARVDSSFAITVAAHTSLGTMPIHLFGSDEQTRRWLPDLASGRRLAAFGLTEAGAGSDAGATRTTARLEGGEWVIDGSKMFITNAGTPISALVTITARTGDDEISNIVVENGTPGYAQSPPLKKMGWRSSDTRELTFSGCRVPQENLLGPRGARLPAVPRDPRRRPHQRGRAGAGHGPGRLRAWRCATPSSASSSAGRSASSRRCSSSWRTWPPRSRPARKLVYKAAWLKDRGRPFAQQAAIAKLYTGELARRACNESLQIHGGYGFMDEYPISRFYRDAKVLEIGEGTNEMQRLVIARGLGL